MVNPDAPNFNPGGIPDRIDNRDHQWSEVGFGSAPFDWSVGFDVERAIKLTDGSMPVFPVKDQDGSGSCGGQAWAYFGAAIEARATKTFEERSAKFIYSQTFVPGGGSAGRANSEIVAKQGWAKEYVLPSYENGNPPTEAFMERSQDITDVVRQDAALAKALSYANVDTDIDTIAQATRDNFGTIILITGANNGTWNSAFPAAPTGGTTWRHWLYCGRAKTINGKKHIGVLNSWGKAVGELGWQWLSEDYFKATYGGEKCISQAWTLVYSDMVPPVTFTHNFQSDIALSQSGAEVVALQKALQTDGEFPANVATTGFYGDVTRRAVLAFQLKYKLDTPTVLNQLAGKRVGPKTRAQLNLLFNK